MELYGVLCLLVLVSTVRGATIEPRVTRTAMAADTKNSTETTSVVETKPTLTAVVDDDHDFSIKSNHVADEDHDIYSVESNDVVDRDADPQSDGSDLVVVVLKLVKLFERFQRDDLHILKKSGLKNLILILTSAAELLLGPYSDVVNMFRSVFTPAFAKIVALILEMINKF